MFLEFYQHLPQTINPIAFTIGFLSVRWYSLMYLVGFVVVCGLLQWRISKGEARNIFQTSKSEFQNTIFDLTLIAFVGGLVGGRLGYVFFYNLSYFCVHPLQIISPYGIDGGKFEGLYGMSYHGAMMGAIFGTCLFAKIKKLNFFAYADFVVPALPLGYFFGRIGNFLNGELIGRATSSKLGVYFASSPNVLSYPSQLLEALAEGILLFVFLWKFRNEFKMQSGSLLVGYIFSYNVVRFVCEFFRSPDAQIGFVFWGLTMGQTLSFIFILISLWWLFLKNKKSATIK